MTPDHLVTIRELTYHLGLSYPSRGHVARMVRARAMAAFADHFNVDLIGARHIHAFTKANLANRHQRHYVLTENCLFVFMPYDCFAF